MTQPTTRVRLYSGRLIHAATEYGAARTGTSHITACGRIIHPGHGDHWMPDGTTVTCRTCERKANGR